MRLHFLLLIMLVISPFVFSIYQDGHFGTFEKGECVNIRTILNVTEVNISSISFPDSKIIMLDKEMQKNGMTFNYSFCNTSELGTYVYDYYDDEGNVYVNSFDVTLNGKPIPSSFLIVIYTLVFIAVFYFGIIYFFKALEEFTLLQMDLKDLIILMTTYFSMWIFYYFSWEYLGNAFVNDMLELAISVGAITHVFLPVVGFMTSFILQKLKFKEKQRVTY